MMPRTRIGNPNGVKLKKRKPSMPWRSSSPLTTRLGAVATSVVMPLISAAMLSGIISRPAPMPAVCEMRNTTGIKMAVTAVELMVAPRPQTTVMRRTISRISLLPAFTISQSPSRWATPVRTRPSPITNSAAIRTMFESLKPASASPMVSTPVKGSAVSMIRATASRRGLLIANITIAAASRARTTTSADTVYLLPLAAASGCAWRRLGRHVVLPAISLLASAASLAKIWPIISAAKYSATGFRDEQIHSQPLRQKFRHELAFDAVSGAVERRGESAQSTFAWRDGHDAAANSAFTWQPDVVQPIAGPFIQPGGRHERQRVVADRRIDHALLGQRIDAAVCERCTHDRQILGADVERALLGVEVGRLLRIEIDSTKALQQPGHTLVTKIGFRRRGIDLFIERKLAAGETGQAVVNELPLGLEGGARHEAGGCDRTGIDHGVGSPVGTAFDGGERIERHSRWVRAELFARMLRAHLLTNEREHKRLRHTHDREFVIGVAGGIDVAAHANHAHAEQLARRPGQRRVN